MSWREEREREERRRQQDEDSWNYRNSCDKLRSLGYDVHSNGLFDKPNSVRSGSIGPDGKIYYDP